MDKCPFMTTIDKVDYCQIHDMRICELVTEETCGEWERIKKEVFMNYRPKGWNNPYSDKHEPHENSWERLCFERGADAMLEGLRRGAVTLRIADKDIDISGFDIVFIPEEE